MITTFIHCPSSQHKVMNDVQNISHVDYILLHLMWERVKHHVLICYKTYMWKHECCFELWVSVLCLRTNWLLDVVTWRKARRTVFFSPAGLQVVWPVYIRLVDQVVCGLSDMKQTALISLHCQPRLWDYSLLASWNFFTRHRQYDHPLHFKCLDVLRARFFYILKYNVQCIIFMHS